MYVWIWRHLPRRPRLRAAVATCLVAAAILVCFCWLFPLVSELMARNGSTVGQSAPPLSSPVLRAA